MITFESDPPTPQDWRATTRAGAGGPFLVGTVADEMAGYAYVSPWVPRPGYRHTVEDSIYLAAQHTGRGFGLLLLIELLRRAAAAGARQMIAVIAGTGNPASLLLHRRAGFEDVGRLRRVGFKHGRWIDTILLQRHLDPAP